VIASDHGTSFGNERIFCVLNFTPRFAKIVSEKYARLGAPAVKDDTASTLCRSLVVASVQNIAEAVATIVQVKEEKWEYDIPELPLPVKSIAVGIVRCLSPGSAADDPVGQQLMEQVSAAVANDKPLLMDKAYERNAC